MSVGGPPDKNNYLAGVATNHSNPPAKDFPVLPATLSRFPLNERTSAAADST